MGIVNVRWGLAGALALGLMGVAALPAMAQSYTLNPARSSFKFFIGHFVVSSTEGKFTNFDGKLRFSPQAPERGTVTVHVSPGSIDTGIAARDEHLRSADFFDVAKFPLAMFESTGLAVTGKSAKLTGMLTLHGVTKPVALDAVLQSPDAVGDRLDFSVKGTLKRSAFGMTGYMGMIGDDVTLDIDAAFDKAR